MLAIGPLSFTNNSVFGLTAAQPGTVNASNTVFLGARPSLDTSALSFINPALGASPAGDGSGGGVPGGGSSTGITRPPPALTLDQYHAMVFNDFVTFSMRIPTCSQQIRIPPQWHCRHWSRRSIRPQCLPRRCLAICGHERHHAPTGCHHRSAGLANKRSPSMLQ